MLRSLTPADTEAIIGLTAATGFFKPSELDALYEVLEDYHRENQYSEHRAVLFEQGGTILGYVYHAPAPMTDRTWYLYWIAVAKAYQGRGIGGQLLAFVERDIRDRGGRLLLIETSSTPHYEPTRRFYFKNGYSLAATIPDFYADGDGLAVFSKRLDR